MHSGLHMGLQGRWVRPQFPEALLELDFTRSYYRLGNTEVADFLQIPGASITGGAGFATAVNRSGQVIGPFAANTLPATDAGVEGWEARTNLLRNSAALSGGGWAQAGGSVTTNDAIAPDGTLTASRIVSAGGGGTYAASSTAAANTAHTFSVFVKVGAGNRVLLGVPQTFFGDTSGSRDAQFDPSTGVWSSVNAALTTGQEQLANGWWRIWMRATSGAAPVSGAPITVYGTPAGHYFAWGAQLEAGSFPSPYIPTTSAAATRTAIRASVPISGASPTSGFAAVHAVNRGSPLILSLGDGTSSNRIEIFFSGTTPTLTVDRAGSRTLNQTLGTVAVGGDVRAAVTWDGTNVKWCLNGGAVASAAAAAPASFVTDYIAGNHNGTFGGAVTRRRLTGAAYMTDAQLQALTA